MNPNCRISMFIGLGFNIYFSMFKVVGNLILKNLFWEMQGKTPYNWILDF